MTLDLDRLRDLAREPQREAMPRTEQFPSMSVQLLAQKAEIDALRRGLQDALVEIEALRRLTVGDQRDRLKLALEAAEAAMRIIPVQTDPTGTGLTFRPDVAAAIPVALWEDLLVAIDYLPDTL